MVRLATLACTNHFGRRQTGASACYGELRRGLYDYCPSCDDVLRSGAKSAVRLEGLALACVRERVASG